MREVRFKGVVIGRIDDETATFYTYRKPEHLMRKYGGFGISDAILSYLAEQGVESVVFTYDGSTGRDFFHCSLAKFLTSNKTHDFNGDTQVFVSLSDMKKTGGESI